LKAVAFEHPIVVEDTLKNIITPQRVRQDTAVGKFGEAPGAQQRILPVNGYRVVEWHPY
jgi:hypothetical protein